jgi:hypothetical protein
VSQEWMHHPSWPKGPLLKILALGTKRSGPISQLPWEWADEKFYTCLTESTTVKTAPPTDAWILEPVLQGPVTSLPSCGLLVYDLLGLLQINSSFALKKLWLGSWHLQSRIS